MSNLLIDKDIYEEKIEEFVIGVLGQTKGIDFLINNNLFEIPVYNFFKKFLDLVNNKEN